MGPHLPANKGEKNKKNIWKKKMHHLVTTQFFTEPLLHITDQTKLVHPEAGTLSTQGMNLNW